MRLKYIKEPDFNLIADLQKGWEIRDNGVKIRLENTLGFNRFEYETLEDFNREWVTLKEPLLPVEIREGFKQWAKFNNVDIVTFYTTDNDFSWFTSRKENSGCVTIDFNKNIDYLEDNKEYTVKELVGE